MLCAVLFPVIGSPVQWFIGSGLLFTATVSLLRGWAMRDNALVPELKCQESHSTAVT